MIARAMATRCCSPPDIRDGRFAGPRRDAESLEQIGGALARLLVGVIPPSAPINSTFSRAVSDPTRFSDWKT